MKAGARTSGVVALVLCMVERGVFDETGPVDECLLIVPTKYTGSTINLPD